MRVLIAYREDGRIKAVLSIGKVEEVKALTEKPYYDEVTIDMPEAGPTRTWLVQQADM